MPTISIVGLGKLGASMVVAVNNFPPCVRKAFGEGVTYCGTLEKCVGSSDVALVVNMDPAFEPLPTFVRSGQTVIDPWRMFRGKFDEEVQYISLRSG